MEVISSLYSTHPFWVWLGVAAVLLAIELSTGTGWLLWPSACAGIMALFVLAPIHVGWAAELVAYAALTIGSTLLSRRFMPKRTHAEPDINDRTSQLLGKTGLAVVAFDKGTGRVLVDGAEWDAEMEAGTPTIVGGKVEVVGVLGGSKLAVRPV